MDVIPPGGVLTMEKTPAAFWATYFYGVSKSQGPADSVRLPQNPKEAKKELEGIRAYTHLA